MMRNASAGFHIKDPEGMSVQIVGACNSAAGDIGIAGPAGQ